MGLNGEAEVRLSFDGHEPSFGKPNPVGTLGTFIPHPTGSFRAHSMGPPQPIGHNNKFRIQKRGPKYQFNGKWSCLVEECLGSTDSNGDPNSGGIDNAGDRGGVDTAVARCRKVGNLQLFSFYLIFTHRLD